MKKGYLLERAPKKYAIYNKLINSYKWQLLRRKKFLANPLLHPCRSLQV